jgi:hypothetical protein
MAVGKTARDWGSTAAERERGYPCDAYLSDPDDCWFRAIDVDVPPAALFPWLCQLKIAPYSYDWINNWGKGSPGELSPGASELKPGQRFMKIFELVEFERDRHVTLTLKGHRIYGDLALSYTTEPLERNRSRLAVKIAVKHPRLLAPINQRIGPYMDIVMMRKQLVTLKERAEGSRAADQRGERLGAGISP